MTWTVEQLRELDGRRAVVTGANGGIGLHTAWQLARHGAEVTLACRDVEAGEEAAARIRADGPAKVAVVRLDLASLASVAEFAEQWRGPLDLLVNNAGVMAPPRRRSTEDGFELQFGTNHLGHFALTGRLLARLLDADSPRVVSVASLAHFRGGTDVLDANAGGRYRPEHAYGNSKLANLLFAAELQRRAVAHRTALTSTAAHPGVSATGLVTSRQGLGAIPGVRRLAPPVLRLLLAGAAAGAEASLYAATVADPGSYTGPQSLGETRGPVGPARRSRLALDTELARRLWERSEELTGVRFAWPSGFRAPA